MDRQQLRERLNELHHELRDPAALDAGKRERLQGLAGDIEALLDRTEGEQTLDTTDLATRLKEAALELEASHPSTTAAIGRVVDLLVQLGI